MKPMTRQYFFVSIGIHMAVILGFLLFYGVLSPREEVIETIQMVDASPAGTSMPGGGMTDITPPAPPPDKGPEKAVLKKEEPEPENTIKYNDKPVPPKKIKEKPERTIIKKPSPPPKKIESHLREKLKNVLTEKADSKKEDSSGADSEKKNELLKDSAEQEQEPALEAEAAQADSSINTPG